MDGNSVDLVQDEDGAPMEVEPLQSASHPIELFARGGLLVQGRRRIAYFFDVVEQPDAMTRLLPVVEDVQRTS